MLDDHAACPSPSPGHVLLPSTLLLPVAKDKAGANAESGSPSKGVRDRGAHF